MAAPLHPLSHPLRALFAVLAGLCVFIPLPFVDDLAVGLLRRLAATVHLSWARPPGAPALPGPDRARLWLGPPRPSGQLWRLALWLLLWPLRKLRALVIKKILRKATIIFAVQDAIEVGARLWHELYVAERALAAGWLGHPPDPAALRQLNAALLHHGQAERSSPLRHLRPVLTQRLLRAVGRAHDPAVAARPLSPPITAAAQALFTGNGPLVEGLNDALHAHFEGAPPTASDGAGASAHS
ncbi:MAG: hypothetical protein JNM72_08885 [Deltaproteobacteria bacterium]|nr:hypothetical protein [Deltaproteobacteria bacterium]